MKRTFEQKGLTVAINIPVVQAALAAKNTLSAVQKVGESKNNRINALAAANVGFDALRTVEQVGQAMDATKALANGNMADANISVSITYGQQKSEQSTDTKGTTANASQINAGNEVNIVAQGAGENSDINVVGSYISGKKSTALSAENAINLLAKEQHHQERSKNKSSGFNAGVAVSYGSNGFAFGITAGGNYGKGYGNGDETSWLASKVGSLQSQTSLSSQKETNIKGSQVLGNKINLTAQNLNIESLQDTMTYKGKQQNISAQATVGYGASISGSYNQSKVNADYASVKTQAGLFAGDEGFDVEVKSHTDLKGAVITSTSQAEQQNKNRFSTGTLTYSDIENLSRHNASGFGISGSVAMNFETPLGDKGIAQSNKQAVNDKGEKLYTNSQGEQTTQAKGQDGKANKPILETGLDSLTGSVSAGFGSDKESQHSQTQSGIGTANIYIQDEKSQFEKTGKTVEQTLSEIKTDTTTETAESRSGKLENRFDKEKVMKEIQVQISTTRDFLDNAQETKDKIIDYYQEPKRKELREAITDWHNAKTEDKEQYREKIDELIKEIYALEHIRTGLDLATGILAGAPKVISASTLLSIWDVEARRETLYNSLKAPPIEDINDEGRLYSNVGHNSGAFDGIKLGGVRMNYGVICGTNNERCETDHQGHLKLNERGHVVYKGDSGKEPRYPNITKLLMDKKVSGGLIGATGGFQAKAGTFFGLSYKPGSLLDKGIEGYAGQHDLVGGQWLFYDENGNGKRNLTEKQQFWVDRASEVAVLGVTPTVLPLALPIEIRFLLFGVR